MTSVVSNYNTPTDVTVTTDSTTGEGHTTKSKKNTFVPNLYVKQSQLGEVVGDGLFTRTFIPTADIHLCDYTGTIYSTSDAMKRKDHSYLMRLGEQKYVDALSHRNVQARYINDCRNSNLYNVKFVKLPRENKASVITTRPIYPDEEIFVDYGKWYWAGFTGGKAMKLPIRKSVELLNKIKDLQCSNKF